MSKNIKYKVKPVPKCQQQQKQQVVYFRVRRPANYQPQQQLIVNREPTKHQNSKQDVSIHQGKQDSQQDKIDGITNLLSDLSIKNAVQYFLKRVDETQDIKIKLSNNSQILQKADKITKQNRASLRQQAFNNSRGITNIKIVDVKEPVVQLGGQSVIIQDFGEMNDYYYVLGKRNKIISGPSIIIPESQLYLLDKLQIEDMLDEQSNKSINDEEDSNRSSNPDYDYPEEDYQEQQENSDDQGIIHKDYYPGQSDDQDRGSQQPQLDQQQLYRNYLKRCKKNKNKQNSDDQYF